VNHRCHLLSLATLLAGQRRPALAVSCRPPVPGFHRVDRRYQPPLFRTGIRLGRLRIRV